MSFEPTFTRLRDCRYGRMLYNVNDVYVGRSFEEYGEYCEFEIELLRQVIREGDVVIDAGANIGAHTVFFSRAVGARGGVFAFEPQRLIFQMLCANLALNELLNVRAMNMALGEAEGTVRLLTLDPRKQNNFGGVALRDDNRGEPLPVIRLDSINLRSCRLIKVDVEGMELPVLRGAEQLIRQFQPALYVENDRADRSRDLVRYIDSLGYDLYWHRPPLFNPNNFRGNANNVFGTVITANMICVPRAWGATMQHFEKVPVPK